MYLTLLKRLASLTPKCIESSSNGNFKPFKPIYNSLVIYLHLHLLNLFSTKSNGVIKI